MDYRLNQTLLTLGHLVEQLTSPLQQTELIEAHKTLSGLPQFHSLSFLGLG